MDSTSDLASLFRWAELERDLSAAIHLIFELTLYSTAIRRDADICKFKKYLRPKIQNLGPESFVLKSLIELDEQWGCPLDTAGIELRSWSLQHDISTEL